MSVRSYPYISGHRGCGGDPGFIGSLCIVHGFFVSDAFFNSVSILRNFLLNLGFKYWLGVAWCYRYADVYFVFGIFASGCGSAVGGSRDIWVGSGFRVGWRGGGGLISIFREFSSGIGKAFILAGGWAIILCGLGRSQPFPKILSLEAFGNSDIPCV